MTGALLVGLLLNIIVIINATIGVAEDASPGRRSVIMSGLHGIGCWMAVVYMSVVKCCSCYDEEVSLMQTNLSNPRFPDTQKRAESP